MPKKKQLTNKRFEVKNGKEKMQIEIKPSQKTFHSSPFREYENIQIFADLKNKATRNTNKEIMNMDLNEEPRLDANPVQSAKNIN